VLGLKDPRRKGCWRVTGGNRNGSLRYDRTSIHFGANEVDSTTRDPDACCESLLVRMQPPEARQQ